MGGGKIKHLIMHPLGKQILAAKLYKKFDIRKLLSKKMTHARKNLCMSFFCCTFAGENDRRYETNRIES